MRRLKQPRGIRRRYHDHRRGCGGGGGKELDLVLKLVLELVLDLMLDLMLNMLDR